MRTLIVTMIAGFAFAQSAFAHPETPGVVAISKAVELGVHRIERLVTLKKIDPMFQTQLYAMRAERTNEGGSTYKVYGYVLPDANNQSSTVAMLSDNNGKVLSYAAGAVYHTVSPVNWPEKDAITLMEDALHFVIEGWVQNPAVKPFYLGLNALTIRPATDAQGKMIVVATATSDDDARTLYIRLKTDGTFISHEIK